MLIGFNKNKAVLNGPAKGTYTVPMETFDKSFTGICLMFEPGESFEPGGKPKIVIEFAKSRLRRTGSAVAFVVLTTIISSLIGIIRPAFSRIFIDRLLTGQNPEWLYPFVIALALLAAIELLVSFISIGVNHRMDGKMASNGNTSFMWKVLRLPMEFFSQRISGDIQQRQGTNASVSGTLVNTFASGFLQTLHYCNALAFSYQFYF